MNDTIALAAVIAGGMFLVALILIFRFIPFAGIVQEKRAGMIQFLGRHFAVAKPGFFLVIPGLMWRRGTVDLRIVVINVTSRTATKGGGFVRIAIPAQVQVDYDPRDPNSDPENAVKAFYAADDPQQQINDLIDNVVRREAKLRSVKELYEDKETIAAEIEKAVKRVIGKYGYVVVNIPITEIEPDKPVLDAMNEVVAAEHAAVAAESRGQAAYIMDVKAAEAAAKWKELQGQGLAQAAEALGCDLSSVPPDKALVAILDLQTLAAQVTVSENADKVLFTTPGPGGKDITTQFAQGAFLGDPGQPAGANAHQGHSAPAGPALAPPPEASADADEDASEYESEDDE